VGAGVYCNETNADEWIEVYKGVGDPPLPAVYQLYKSVQVSIRYRQRLTL